MKILVCSFAVFLFFTACDTSPSSSNHSSEEMPASSLQTTKGQQDSYTNLMQKLSAGIDFASDERMRFLMIDKKRSLLHFFSIHKKDQQYFLGAEFEACTQVGNISQLNYEKNCKDLFQDEYTNFDKLLRSILETPRHDKTESGEMEFYFQHFSMTDSVIFGTEEDIFALELYLAFLRLTKADDGLIRRYEEKKNRLISM